MRCDDPTLPAPFQLTKVAKIADEIGNWESPSDTSKSKDDENVRTKSCILANVRGHSKWSEYITEESNCGAKNGENMAIDEMDILKMMMINDEMVEDDIHPDFK